MSHQPLRKPLQNSEVQELGTVLNRTYKNINQLDRWGYPFPLDDEGNPHRRSLQGPEYMRLMQGKQQENMHYILDQMQRHGIWSAFLVPSWLPNQMILPQWVRFLMKLLRAYKQK